LNPFHNRPDEWALYEPLIGDTMLELGGKINAPYTYKAYFESLGFRHVSIDWNGQHGALKRDLRNPLWDELGRHGFDMVSNMGTTEHVSGPGGQRGVWENIHHLTKPGGVYVGQTPYHDGKSWYWHGEHYPTEAFFESFCALNNWDLERIYVDREIPNQNLYVRMRKGKLPPLWNDVFHMPDLSLIHYNRRRPR
jgi:hypothetical protein